jgi:hypothetical protein
VVGVVGGRAVECADGPSSASSSAMRSTSATSPTGWSTPRRGGLSTRSTGATTTTTRTGAGCRALREYVQQHRDAGHPADVLHGGHPLLRHHAHRAQFGEQYRRDERSVDRRVQHRPDARGLRRLLRLVEHVLRHRTGGRSTSRRRSPASAATPASAGVRLDEFGHRGFVCTSDKHEHLFAEPGHNAWLQAVSRACELVREAMDEVDPKLRADHRVPRLRPSRALPRRRDRLREHVTCAPIRPGPGEPLPLLLPALQGLRPRPQHRRFARLAALQRDGPVRRRAAARGVLPDPASESSDLFDGRDVEPLVPTLREHVYANRFSGRDKQITMLYNDNPFTVDGMLLPVEREEGWHWFELMRGVELEPDRARGRMGRGAEARPGEVACIARLPERLERRARADRLPGMRFRATSAA